ncbi:class I SAM-dependent methyltransferase [Metabacillus indicus]|uniref:SAM-dependent methyltransferase n=2 Tax=Metabacillus indicus TaxID=246786 RepID=A0A084GZY3_METID|nr:rRNA adenine N-6-methyltransferase family protein [Metabacillus indicus]KEZ50565.1 SAM-dependent methyltransferase [Metabacillus indicus LMG 22858]KEZ52895.1 SAM-dependent methyltransferase [Metabacillus indicus]
MNSLAFFLEYINKPRSTGALLPSSPKLAECMTEAIDFQTADFIIEYGPGTGVFTEKLIKKRRIGTRILLIEQNEVFSRLLKDRFFDVKDLVIVNGSAENTSYYMKKYGFKRADYILSGLPFASIPSDTADLILSETASILGAEGKFITFQYTLLKKGLFKKYFSALHISKVYMNLPPAYVLACTNGERNESFAFKCISR